MKIMVIKFMTKDEQKLGEAFKLAAKKNGHDMKFLHLEHMLNYVMKKK